MAVPGLPVIGLVWDGLDLQRPDLDLMFTITEGLDDLPSVRASDQVIPFRSGRLPTIGIADNRAVVAHGWIAGSGVAPRTSYRAYLDALKAKLDPTMDPRILVVTLEDGGKRWIRAIPRLLDPGDGIGGEFSAFAIEWKACDPYWYGPWGVLALDEGLFMDTGLTLDQARTLVINPTSPAHYVTFDALGTTDAEKVRVEIDGPSTSSVTVSNLSVVAGANYGFTFAAGALLAGQTVVVDSGLRVVTRDGAQARGSLSLFPDNRHGEYLRLRPGNNTIEVVGRPAEVRVIFNPTYL